MELYKEASEGKGQLLKIEGWVGERGANEKCMQQPPHPFKAALIQFVCNASQQNFQMDNAYSYIMKDCGGNYERLRWKYFPLKPIFFAKWNRCFYPGAPCASYQRGFLYVRPMLPTLAPARRSGGNNLVTRVAWRHRFTALPVHPESAANRLRSALLHFMLMCGTLSDSRGRFLFFCCTEKNVSLELSREKKCLVEMTERIINNGVTRNSF